MTIVCQGLQSCLESQLVETTTLRLKLVAPKSIGLTKVLDSDTTKEIREKCPSEETNNQVLSNLDLGGWTFLHSLSNSSQNPQTKIDIEKSYVPPSLRLSEKSLELCTESLGSETGSDSSESSIFFPLSPLDSWSGKSSPTRDPRKNIASRKVNSHNFPPPLTTISGSNSLHVRPHREDGKLIIKAVQNPSTQTFFQAERSHGRLRLSFLKNYDSNIDAIVQENEENNEDNKDGEFENDVSNEENQEDDEEEESDEYMRKDMDANSRDVEGGMEMEKLERPSKCKECGHGDKGLCNWEPFWVAAS